MKTIFETTICEVPYSKVRELRQAAKEVRTMGEGLTAFEKTVAHKQLEVVERLLKAAEAF